MSESNVSHAWIIFSAFFCICWGVLNVIFMFSAPAFCRRFRFFLGFPLITEKGGGGLYTGFFNDPIVVVYCTAGSAREEVGANPVGHPIWQDRSVLPPREY